MYGSQRMRHALTVQSHQLLVPTELYGMMARAFTPISQALKLSNCKRCADYGLITPLKSAASGLNQQHFLQTIRLSMKADFHSLDVVDKIMDSCYAGLHPFAIQLGDGVADLHPCLLPNSAFKDLRYCDTCAEFGLLYPHSANLQCTTPHEAFDHPHYEVGIVSYS